jgi:gluconokinase
MARVLALDVGTSSLRARVYDEHGRPLEGIEERTTYEPSVDGELDAECLAEEVRAAEARARAAAGAVDAVAISCFWHSLLPLDSRGRPIGTVLTWQDTRAAGDAEELARRLDAPAVHARTGCPLHPSFWPAKLRRLRRAAPELFAAAARFVSFADFLRGETVTSVSIASGTGLLDVHRCVWDEELLTELELTPERLPELSDEPFLLGDGAASNLGAGCTTADRAALMIGTSGAYRVLFEADDAEVRPGLFLYRLDRRRFVAGGALSDGGNLWEWLARTLRLPEARDVSERPPGAGGIVFLPLLGGERSPGWNPRPRGAVAGLALAAEPLDLFQAALEGVACRFADVAERLPEVREIVATGRALLANRGWVQILADVLERPVTLSAVDEASARGAAVFALERLDEEPEPAPLADVVEPRPERAAAYRELRERQRALYEAVT